MLVLARRIAAAGALMVALVVTTLVAGPSAAQAAVRPAPQPNSAVQIAATPEREVWFTHWFPAPVCRGDICSIRSDHDIPRFYISGQNFSAGRVYVGIFRLDGSPIVSTHVTAGSHQGFVSFSWGWKANMIDCAAIGAPITNNSFIQAKDLTTNRWSNRIHVTTGCHVL